VRFLTKRALLGISVAAGRHDFDVSGYLDELK